MDNREITIEEKIDYIYDRMRKQQRLETVSSILKWGSRLLVVVSILYFFFIKLPALKDDIIDSMTPDIPSFSTESITDSDLLNQVKNRFFGNQEEKIENIEDPVAIPSNNNYY